ncbi:DUF742 domain-containing protein [Dactylosporangium sp. NPDC048998]|uniref:DUF742 domain-containing protein n=1 Tax=Dactylosporangium sp. NPDC048998 TaxID=3363976 RepID=UPI0037139232
MAYDVWDGDDPAEAGRLVPLYILVNGQTSPRNTNLDLATQVIAILPRGQRLEPEYEEIVSRCVNWMSIAELSAYLHLPLAIMKVMVDVLLDQGYLGVGSPAQEQIADLWVLQEVLAGLERI